VVLNINFTSKELEKENHNINPLYKLKDDFLKHAYSNEISYFIDHIDEFMDLKPYNSDLSKYFDEYYSFVYNYYKLSDINQKKTEARDIFIQAFNTIWDLIAISNFRNDIRDYYIQNNMNLENIDLHFAPELNMAIERFTELLDAFDDMFAITDFFNDKETQELIRKIS